MDPMSSGEGGWPFAELGRPARCFGRGRVLGVYTMSNIGAAGRREEPEAERNDMNKIGTCQSALRLERCRQRRTRNIRPSIRTRRAAPAHMSQSPTVTA